MACRSPYGIGHQGQFDFLAEASPCRKLEVVRCHTAMYVQYMAVEDILSEGINYQWWDNGIFPETTTGRNPEGALRFLETDVMAVL